MKHIKSTMDIMIADFEENVENQDNDKWDSYSEIRFHTQTANDARYIWRQLMSLVKMLEERA